MNFCVFSSDAILPFNVREPPEIASDGQPTSAEMRVLPAAVAALGSSFTRNWAHQVCGLLMGLSLASVAVVGLAIQQAGKTFLELCRDSGVRRLAPRPTFPYVETFLVVVVMGLALLCWHWGCCEPLLYSK